MLFRVLIALCLLMLGASPAAMSKPPATSSREIEAKLFEWCTSFFTEAPTDLPFQRPVQKLNPLDLKALALPQNLVAQTQVIGNLPTHIDRYQGLWIWPSATSAPPLAAFVERLTPTEMTMALAEAQTENGTLSRRLELVWTGLEFSDVAPDGRLTVLATVSPHGEALSLLISGRLPNWLKEPDGRSEGAIEGDMWLACLISSKHY